MKGQQNNKASIEPYNQVLNTLNDLTKGKKYIVNKKLGIFVILDYCNLEITNHVYHYEMKLTHTDASKLAKIFNDKVESDALSYENEIRENIQSSLNILLQKVVKDLNEL